MKIMKNCIICEKEIHRTKSNAGDRLRRKKTAVTCCKYCSKMYARVYHYIITKIKKENSK